jgi:hypothetical protein
VAVKFHNSEATTKLMGAAETLKFAPPRLKAANTENERMASRIMPATKLRLNIFFIMLLLILKL